MRYRYPNPDCSSRTVYRSAAECRPTGFVESIRELADIVKELVPNYKLRVVLEQSEMVYPLMDTSKIEQELGYKPKYSVVDACEDYLKTIGGI